ncbi:MAG: mechanosensitive ion channel domain-containing protein, partial [Thermodesulfobacteriota bacterium]
DAVVRPLFVFGEHGYSALDLIALPALLAALWLASGAVTRGLRARVLRRAEGAAQDTIATFARYALVLLGGIVILEQWGVDVRSVTMAASVLGVGIGFGLQNIANNFVSGLLIGAERPIRAGDYVTLGELSGTVERIGARSTEILTNDRVKILVPNSRFLEQEVVNWTHGDPVCRLHVPVGVAYGSDVDEVRTALLEAADGHPQVLADPAPRVELKTFDDSAISFELLVWTRSPRAQATIASDLNYRIHLCLARHGLSIPFPQRELTLPPQVEEILVAWARRELGLEHLDAERTTIARLREREAKLALARWDTPLGPRVWSAAEVAAVVAGMRGEGSVPIHDRRHLLAVYPRCFVGREAVDWLVRELRVPRDEAVALGRLLVERGVIHHVLDEHGFRDGNFFYRFRADEEELAREMSATSATRDTSGKPRAA